MRKVIITAMMGILTIACKNSEKNVEKEVASSEEVSQNTQSEDQWKYLFEGENAEGWRAYNGEKGTGLPQGWIVEDNTLKSLGEGGDLGGDIVYGEEEFDEFELYLEWKISPEGNSGVFYHVVEDKNFDSPYFAAPEYQIIDQEGFPHKLELWQSIGADYGMYDPNYDQSDLRPVGEWNTTRIRFTEEKVTYWLNGKKTVEFEPWSADWEKRKKEGKWKDYPEYGKAKSGLIGLQDHGSYTWFRNIKIKEL
ncbi:3-keto-disaccharide hydrolase [Salegentibacter sp. F14]